MRKRKTFLHFTPLAAIGGCEVNCLRVIEGLPGHDHRVLVFDESGPMSARWRAAGARVEHLGAWRGGTAKFLSALTAWAGAEVGPDGIFYWSTSRVPSILRALRRWDVPWVVHLGNPAPSGVIPVVRRRLQEASHPSGGKVTLAACSRQVALSHQRVRYFRRFPIEVVYNPVAVERSGYRTYRMLPPGSRPRIGMVARLDAIKDHATLIRAMARVAAIHPDAILELAGDGNLRPKLEKEARRLRVAGRVKFLGFTEVVSLLDSWDVYVHSTTSAEGMGTAVAEAMMAGTPCVVSDLPVMHEVCGEDGALYAKAGDPADLGRVLLALLADQPRRTALGQAGRERAVRMFSLPAVAREYLRLIAPEAKA